MMREQIDFRIGVIVQQSEDGGCASLSDCPWVSGLVIVGGWGVIMLCHLFTQTFIEYLFVPSTALSATKMNKTQSGGEDVI